LTPWRAVGLPLARHVCQGDRVAQALNRAPVRTRQFVSASALPDGAVYEKFIYDTGQIPTRDGLHDFFNGLTWLQFPKAKAQLNALHVAQIAQVGTAPHRGAPRDGLTLLDENGALLQAPDALWDALCRKDWAQLFGPLRALWSQASLTLFGHALMEKLVLPRAPITAHVYRVHAPGGQMDGLDGLDALDHWLAGDLCAERLACKPFAPLPVLGVPGWWPANTDPSFYADTQVFRMPLKMTLG